MKKNTMLLLAVALTGAAQAQDWGRYATQPVPPPTLSTPPNMLMPLNGESLVRVPAQMIPLLQAIDARIPRNWLREPPVIISPSVPQSLSAETLAEKKFTHLLRQPPGVGILPHRKP